MDAKIRRTEGGCGKRRQHGYPVWPSGLFKNRSRPLRRRQDVVAVEEQLGPFLAEDDIGNRCPRCGPGPCDPEEHEVDVFAFFLGVPVEELLAEWEGR